MIRPVTAICLLLAGTSGLALYQAKHRAQLLDREIVQTLRATAQAEERVAALRAEWALLNEPERLAELAERHLGLRALTPQQFVALDEIAARLPSPLPPDAAPSMPDGDEAEEAPPPPDAVAAPVPRPPVPPVVLAQLARPVPLPPPAPTPAPVHVAARAPVPPRPAPDRASPAERSVERSVERPIERHVERAVVSPSPRAAAPVLPAYAAPMTAPPPRSTPMIQRVAQPAPLGYAPQPAFEARPDTRPEMRQVARPGAASAVASSLGGVRPTLAPPVPFDPVSPR